MSVDTLTYPKIETLYRRDETFNVTDRLTRTEFGLINSWIVTEKIDGTNIRLIWMKGPTTPVHFRVAGKSDDAELHPGLWKTCTVLCAAMRSEVEKIMDEYDLDTYVLFGEGYGSKIQSGGYYRADQGFILFDVLAGKSWLDENQITDTATRLGLDRVPVLTKPDNTSLWTLPEIVALVKPGYTSTVALIESHRHAEGVVARPPVPLYDRRGQRIIFKLKERDYRAGKR